MAARALWRATGTAEADLAKPIVAIANSYTQFVPGHVHLKPLGELVAEEIHKAGAVAKEFHTIAVDDGIAMGHESVDDIKPVIRHQPLLPQETAKHSASCRKCAPTSRS